MNLAILMVAVTMSTTEAQTQTQKPQSITDSNLEALGFSSHDTKVSNLLHSICSGALKLPDDYYNGSTSNVKDDYSVDTLNVFELSPMEYTLHDEENNTSGVKTAVGMSISEAERQEYLQQLQDKTTLTMIPAMVLLLLMAVVGIIGNSLVLYVYSRKFNINGTRVLILVVAAFDLLANVIVIPGEVYDMLHVWDFDQPWVCRIRLYINAFTTMVSAQLLTALAVVRYRKVCVPFGWQISTGQAKVIASIIVICSTLFAAPYGVINGRRTRSTPRPEINAYECTIDDAYADTIWPLANGGFFILLFLGNSFTIVILYFLVGAKALRHSRAVGKGTSSSGPASSDDKVATSSTSAGNSKSKDSGGDNKSDNDRKMSDGKNTSFVKISTSQRTVTFSKKRGSQKRSTASDGDKDTRADEKGRVNEEKSTIEYFTDDEDAERPARIPSSPNGDVNLFMVRELTMKLRAVQKQNSREEEQNAGNGQNSDESSQQVENQDKEPESPGTRISGTKSVQFQISDGSVERCSRNVSGEGKSGQTPSKTEETRPKDNQEHHLNRGDTANCNKSGQQDCSTQDKSSESDDHQNDSLNGEVAGGGTQTVDNTEEPMSEFARAMQWVDITYCLKDGEPEEEEAQHEEEKPHGAKLSKSGSFSRSRKISRDNSFLRKNRKFRETLSDTLSRARKSKNLRKSSFAAVLKDEADKSEGAKNKNNVSVHSAGVKPKRSLNRTTVMLIIISAVYIIGFLPYLSLVFYFTANPDEKKALGFVGLSLYNLFLRFYLLNCAANAVIYGICDLTFRKKCVSAIRKKLCCIRSSPVVD